MVIDILQKIKEVFAKRSDRYVDITSIEKEFVKTCEAAKKVWEQREQEADIATEQQKTSTESGGQYSVVENVIDNNGKTYGNAVLLDTNFFDGISPRNWGKALKRHLKNRVQGSTFIMPVFDENGVEQNLEFAKNNERVSKNGKNQHPVLGELYSAKGNIEKLSTVHIDEVVEVSENDLPYKTAPDGHGWMDANGWLHRTAYVINAKNGNIYQIAMSIAKTSDGRMILYSLSGKTKKVGNADVNSLNTKGSRQNSNSKYSIPTSAEKVKTKLEDRVSGDDLLNAQDLIEEIESVGGAVDENGYVTVYHRTTENAKQKILSTGKMSAKEDGIFFSTKIDGQAEGYGNAVVEMRIPVEKSGFG